LEWGREEKRQFLLHFKPNLPDLLELQTGEATRQRGEKEKKNKKLGSWENRESYSLPFPATLSRKAKIHGFSTSDAHVLAASERRETHNQTTE